MRAPLPARQGAQSALIGSVTHGLAGGFLLPYLLFTYLFSAAVSIHAEEPFRKWLLTRINEWADAHERAGAGKLAIAGAGGSAGGAPSGAAEEADGQSQPSRPLLPPHTVLRSDDAGITLRALP